MPTQDDFDSTHPPAFLLAERAERQETEDTPDRAAASPRGMRFLVDQCLFNRLMVFFCEAVASQDPRRRAVLWPDISIARTAAESGEQWLREFLETDPSLYSACRDRAHELARGVAGMTESITEAYGEGELSVTLVALPESLLLPLQS